LIQEQHMVWLKMISKEEQNLTLFWTWKDRF
jgi:hypothetical protein